MEKIRELLQKCNLSEESANQICESLDGYTAQVRQNLEEEFKTRMDKAMKVCLEETQAHKAELARRVQVFLETKTTAIEETVSRQAAQKDSAAMVKLERIAGLVEDINLDANTPSELKTELGNMRKVATRLLGERNAARTRATHLESISNRLVKANRQLAESAKKGTQARPGKTQPLEEGRLGGQARTTRRTLQENVQEAPKSKQAQQLQAPNALVAIADQLEDL